MQPTFYPQLNEAQILPFNLVLQQLRQDPQYLENSPYNDTTKKFFGAIMQAAPVAVDAEEQDLEKQINGLIADLNAFASTLTGKDHAEKLGYFRTKTSLIEKLVSLKEKVLNLKEMATFQETILGFLDDFCSKEQISQLKERLK